MYYLTQENFPVETNCEPQKGWTQITEKQYRDTCAERNAKYEAEQKQREEEMKPIRERQKLINERMRKIAEKQLIDEGIL